jgi:hypothetical protein
MQHLAIARSAGWLATAGLIGVALITPAGALATQPPPGHTVTICHATASDANPYLELTVDIASSGDPQGGHAGDTGPIWSAGLKDKHLAWGDIIPAYMHGDFNYPGLNATPQGLAILAGHCTIQTPPVAPTSTPTSTGAAPTATDPLPTTAPDPLPTATDQPPAGTDAVPTATDQLPAGTDAAATDPAPTDPAPTQASTIGQPGQPTPASTPNSNVLGETGRAQLTPPPTDTVGSSSTTTGNSWRLFLMAVAGILAAVLILTPATARNRR